MQGCNQASSANNFYQANLPDSSKDSTVSASSEKTLESRKRPLTGDSATQSSLMKVAKIEPSTITANSAILDSSKDDARTVMSVYRDGKAIAKMIGLHEWIYNECDELLHCDYIQAASSTLIVPEIPQHLFYDFGFILDCDKCTLREIYPLDVSKKRLDVYGNPVVWDTIKKRHCKVIFEKDKATRVKTEFKGDFEISEPLLYNPANKKLGMRKIESIPDLISLVKDNYSKFNKKAFHNEIILDYPLSAIIAVIGKIDAHSNIEETKKKLHLFNKMVFKYTNLILPCFIFNSDKGHLIHCDRT